MEPLCPGGTAILSPGFQSGAGLRPPHRHQPPPQIIPEHLVFERLFDHLSQPHPHIERRHAADRDGAGRPRRKSLPIARANTLSKGFRRPLRRNCQPAWPRSLSILESSTPTCWPVVSGPRRRSTPAPMSGRKKLFLSCYEYPRKTMASRSRRRLESNESFNPEPSATAFVAWASAARICRGLKPTPSPLAPG